jgi:hypothetical protein
MPRNWERGRYAKVVHQIERELKEGSAFEALIYRDFECTPAGFMSQLYSLASAYGVKVSCAKTSTRVIYRFYNANSPWKPNLSAFAVVIRARRDEEISGE